MAEQHIDRRSFLATAGLGALAIATGSRAGAASHPQPAGIVKSLKYYMIGEKLTLVEKFKLVKELGFGGIELDSPNQFKLEEVLRARDESGLPIHGLVDSVHWRDTLSHADPKVQQAGIIGLKTAIRDAKAYGAQTVLLVPAVVNKQVSYQQAWERSHANIKKVLPFAEEHGIKIGIENVWNKFLLSPLETARYIDEFQSPWIGVHFDIGNVVEFGFPQDWIRTLGKRIIKLDVKEYGFKKRFDYKLGEGDIDWADVRKALAEIGYSGYASAEIPGGNKEYLKDVSARMSKILGVEDKSA